MFRKLFRKALMLCERIVNTVTLNSFNVKTGADCTLRGIIGIEGTCNIELGDAVRINSRKRYNIIGGDSRTVFRTVGSGKILIGKGCGISNSTFVSAEKIELGDNVLIGGGCKLYDTDFHPIDMNARIKNENESTKTKSILIKEGAFIGAHSIILKGVTIGKGAIVGAGSVVTKSIPDQEIWAGNPAQFIRKI